jgi:hypothetical protein
MHVVIYHNPNCSNSRKALKIIRAREPRPLKAGETVRWTVSCGERREPKRAAARVVVEAWRVQCR